MTRSIPETAAVVIGFLGRLWRVTTCKSGHSVDKVVIIEGITASGWSDTKSRKRLDLNVRVTEVVLVERNNGMNGISHPSILVNSRVFRFGLVDGAKLHDRESFGLWSDALSELSHSSSVTLKTSPFRESFKGL